MTHCACASIILPAPRGNANMAAKIVGFLLLILLCTCTAKKKPSVKIITESKPSDCTDEAEKGDTLVVHYTGALEDGQVFDTSKQEGREPFEVTLGKNQVIPGWEEGLLGMCPGEERKLIIPSKLAYGDRGVPNVIPPGATLIFHVELLQLKKKSLVSIPQGNGFYVTLGVVALLTLGGYELYKRYNKQSDESSTVTSKKSGKKGKRDKKK